MSKLKISFELDSTSYENVDSYSLGDITIEGEYGSISSFGKYPDQSMMIFISLVDLLDGVNNLLTNENIRSFCFVGVDCSLQFTLRKKGELVLIEDGKGKLIGTMNKKNLWQIFGMRLRDL